MLKRCYSLKYQKLQPTYKECIVCEEWLIFSNFKKWMEMQDWYGKELDKDIIKPKNNIYCPEYCIFVSRYVNNLLNIRKNRKDLKYPQGVYFEKHTQKFVAEITIDNRKKNLGRYATPHEASIVYIKNKRERILNFAEKTSGRLRAGLIAHAEAMVC